MAIRQHSSYRDALFSGLSGLADIGTAKQNYDKTQADLKDAEARRGLYGQEKTLNDQKIAQGDRSYKQQLAQDQMIGSLQQAGADEKAAMDGTPTANGTAVDFQAVKGAHEKRFDQEAQLWNLTRKDTPNFVPKTADDIRQMHEEEDQTFDLGQRKGEAEINKDNALAESGSYMQFTLGNGNVGILNHKTGKIVDTGEKAVTKPGQTVSSPQALAEKAQAGIDLIDQMIGKGDTGKTHPGFSGAVGAKGLSQGFGLLKEPVAGSKEADFKALLDQVGGQAFMDARQGLKGGGAITDMEGLKAQKAITRMATSQSEGEFINAAKEYRSFLAKERDKNQGGGQAGGLSDDDIIGMHK